ncbi:MAG TPA: hypothetical protein VEF89_12730 [Solirubrobacteraceae bacterium]|nr:hypothetical protein [Solirubrobacteraceae bacterium]
MPPAKKPATSSSRARAAFKEPAALTRLTKSLDAAQEALTELRTHTGRDANEAARDLYKDLRTFVSSARRDTGKLTKALARDFAQAQKQLAAAPRAKAPATTTTGQRKRQSPSRRTTGKTS